MILVREVSLDRYRSPTNSVTREVLLKVQGFPHFVRRTFSENCKSEQFVVKPLPQPLARCRRTGLSFHRFPRDLKYELMTRTDFTCGTIPQMESRNWDCARDSASNRCLIHARLDSRGPEDLVPNSRRTGSMLDRCSAYNQNCRNLMTGLSIHTGCPVYNGFNRAF